MVAGSLAAIASLIVVFLARSNAAIARWVFGPPAPSISPTEKPARSSRTCAGSMSGFAVLTGLWCADFAAGLVCAATGAEIDIATAQVAAKSVRTVMLLEEQGLYRQRITALI